MDSLDQARTFFAQGIAHYEAGRWDAAERDFAAALALAPGRPSVLTNLGAARLQLGRLADAIGLLEEALAQEPDNAEAQGHLATALAEAGRREPALAAAVRASDLAPANPAVWTLRGTLERELGQPAAARHSFRQALAHGADPELLGYYLAAVSEEPAPSTPPLHYVESLFDRYEAGFDRHLVEELGYRAPQVLAQGLGRERYACALDLGCGTGLLAPLLRPRADRLEGLDLSAAMVARARERGLYDAVEQGELAQVLATTPQRYDLLVAGDVFIYVGALEPVFAGAARVLQPGGEFCFSLEAADEHETVRLRPSLRYAHSERYIRMLAGPHGFEVRAVARHPLRIEQGRPLAGLFAWLTRAGGQR